MEQNHGNRNRNAPHCGPDAGVGREKARHPNSCNRQHGKQESHAEMEFEQLFDVGGKTSGVRLGPQNAHGLQKEGIVKAREEKKDRKPQGVRAVVVRTQPARQQNPNEKIRPRKEALVDKRQGALSHPSQFYLPCALGRALALKNAVERDFFRESHDGV